MAPLSLGAVGRDVPLGDLVELARELNTHDLLERQVGCQQESTPLKDSCDPIHRWIPTTLK